MESETNPKTTYRFGRFTLDPATQVLRCENSTVHLASLPFRILLHLIENRDRIVGRDELLEKFWEGRDVYDDALRKAVAAVRKALDDQGRPAIFIETVYGRGFRFVGELTVPSDAVRGENEGSAETPHKRTVLWAILGVVLLLFALLAMFGGRSHSPDLETNANVKAPEPIRSIAVMPIENLTADPANDYLADGLTESLINELSQIQELKVISRGSTFVFKGKPAPPQEVGAKLGVQALIEGGFRRNGDSIRLDVRLVRTDDGSVVWASDQEDRTLKDIFDVENGIICQIVTGIQVKLCGEIPPAERYTKNVKAYQFYLQGLYYRNIPTPENLNKAVSSYNEALKVDPDYALAHEGLATVYMLMEFNTVEAAPGTAAPKALEHAEKAIAADPDLVGAYIVLGAVKSLRNYDLDERERYYLEALRRRPMNRTARLWLSNIYTARGAFERAEAEILKAQEVDPLSFGVRLTLAELYEFWGKPEKTIEQARLMLDLSPNDEYANYLIAKSELRLGNLAAAADSFAKCPTFSYEGFLLHVRDGEMDEARRLAEKFAASDDGRRAPYSAAIAFAAIGDRENAIAQLQRAYTMRQANLISMKVQPEFEILRSDDRYIQLLKLVHLGD